MSKCTVPSCKNNWKKRQICIGDQLSYHTFPFRDPALLLEWCRNIGVKKEHIGTSRRICNEHFTSEDFERDLQNELLGLPLRKKLKRDAVPSLLLHPPPPEKRVTRSTVGVGSSKKKKGKLKRSVKTNQNKGTTEIGNRKNSLRKDVRVNLQKLPDNVNEAIEDRYGQQEAQDPFDDPSLQLQEEDDVDCKPVAYCRLCSNYFYCGDEPETTEQKLSKFKIKAVVFKEVRDTYIASRYPGYPGLLSIFRNEEDQSFCTDCYNKLDIFYQVYQKILDLKKELEKLKLGLLQQFLDAYNKSKNQEDQIPDSSLKEGRSQRRKADLSNLRAERVETCCTHNSANSEDEKEDNEENDVHVISTGPLLPETTTAKPKQTILPLIEQERATANSESESTEYYEIIPLTARGVPQIVKNIEQQTPNILKHFYKYNPKDIISKHQNLSVKKTNALGGNNVVQTSKNLKCVICMAVLQNNAALIDHIKAVHRYYPCDICEERFRFKTHLTNHKRNAHPPKKKTFTCNHCAEDFENIKDLWKHKRISHKPHPQICEICGKAFVSSLSLKNHVSNVHKRLKRFTCDQCGKGFFSSAYLKCHIGDIHTGIKTVKCKFWHETFNKAFRCRRHMTSVHAEQYVTESNVLCTKCYHVFGNQSLLSEHMEKSHHKCQQIFFTKPEWECHIAGHAGKKPFQCKFCSVRCSRKDKLKEHENRHLKKTQFLDCKYCDKQFLRNKELKIHVQADHP